jgi:hypothetical protein
MMMASRDEGEIPDCEGYFSFAETFRAYTRIKEREEAFTRERIAEVVKASFAIVGQRVAIVADI